MQLLSTNCLLSLCALTSITDANGIMKTEIKEKLWKPSLHYHNKNTIMLKQLNRLICSTKEHSWSFFCKMSYDNVKINQLFWQY